MLEKLPTEAVALMVAAFGGIAKYLNQYMTAAHPQFVIGMAFANLFVSAFTGFIAGELALSYNASLQITCVAAGCGGWLGAATMDFIRTIISRHLNPPRL